MNDEPNSVVLRQTREINAPSQSSLGVTNVGRSVMDRISQMQESSESWRVRSFTSKESLISSPEHSTEVRHRLLVTNDRNAPTVAATRPKSVLELTQSLQSSSESWRNRVASSDAAKFSAQAKRDNTDEIQSVLKPRSISTIVKSVTTTSSHKASSSTPVMTSTEPPVHSPTWRSICLPGDHLSSAVFGESTIVESSNQDLVQLSANGDGDLNNSSPVLHESNHIEMNEFFSKEVNEMEVDTVLGDLDDILSEQLDPAPALEHVNLSRPRGPGRPRKINAQNLTKAETKPAAAPSVPAPASAPALLSNGIRPELSESAKAGLAHKEDMSKVKDILQHTADIDLADRLPSFVKDMVPYKGIMLLLVKGRYHIQIRLVEPIVESLNRGDCFVLVSPNYVFLAEGQACNRIEKSKAHELAKRLLQNNDLGANNHRQLAELMLHNAPTSGYISTQEGEFWSSLGYQGSTRPTIAAGGPDDEDELYEEYVVETNCVYRVTTDGRLEPLKQWWGRALQHRMLNSNEAYVLDFGAEVYLWTGKNVNLATKKTGAELAKLLVQQGYDFSNCSLNPLAPLAVNSTMKSDEPRPSWILLGKVNENGETDLFKAKFTSWPAVKLFASKSVEDRKSMPPLSPEDDLRDTLSELDVRELYRRTVPSTHLILQGRSVGRGGQWTEAVDGIQRHFNVVTHDVVVWQVLQGRVVEVANANNVGLFHEDDTFVIRWRYAVHSVGRHGSNNSERDPNDFQVVFFLWQGRTCKTTEKTVSALLAIDLNKEKKPQHRIDQGQEPPCFCRLFSGQMVIFQGSSTSEQAHGHPLMVFTVRGVVQEEAYLLEVTPQQLSESPTDCLRSRTSLVFVHCNLGVVYIWHGKWALDSAQVAARQIVHKLNDNQPNEFHCFAKQKLTVHEVHELDEPSEFWTFLQQSVPWKSSINQIGVMSTRIWRLTSSKGELLASELMDPLRPDPPLRGASVQYTPLPCLQTALYHVPQPALFIVDAGHCIYLWQGAWPEGSETQLPGSGSPSQLEVSASKWMPKPASAHMRFHAEKVAALKAMIAIYQLNRSRLTGAFLVSAGVEPEEFRQLFPFWIVDEESRNSSVMEGRIVDATENAEDALHRLLNATHTWEELSCRPQQEDVNPVRLEAYLSDQEFQSVFGLSKEAFYQLPFWKRKLLKQEHKLA